MNISWVLENLVVNRCSNLYVLKTIGFYDIKINIIIYFKNDGWARGVR